MVNPREPSPEQQPEQPSDSTSGPPPEGPADSTASPTDQTPDPAAGSTPSSPTDPSPDDPIELPAELTDLFADEPTEPATELPDLFADEPTEPAAELPDLFADEPTEPAAELPDPSPDDPIELPAELTDLFADEPTEPAAELPDLFADEPTESAAELPDLFADEPTEPAAELPDLFADEPTQPAEPTTEPPESSLPVEQPAAATVSASPPAQVPAPTAPSDRTPSPALPRSIRDRGPLVAKLPFNLYRATGLMIILATIGTILGVGLTQTTEDGQEGVLDVPLISSEQPADSDDATGLSSSPTAPDSGSVLDQAASPSPWSEPEQSRTKADRKADSDRSRSRTPGRQDRSPGTTAVTQPGTAGTAAGIGAQGQTGITGGSPAAETPPQPSVDISDVPTDHWAYPFVKALHEEGIIPEFPDGKFQPDKPVTRAELAAQIQRAFEDDSGQRTLNFTDVPKDYWADAAIKQAVKTGFMNGYPEGDFRPNLEVPRYEALVALVSGLDLDKVADPDPSLEQFQDRQELPDWSQGQLAAATEAGLVVNHPDPDQLNPKQPATRAETAVMIYQALVKNGKVKAIESEHVITP